MHMLNWNGLKIPDEAFPVWNFNLCPMSWECLSGLDPLFPLTPGTDKYGQINNIWMHQRCSSLRPLEKAQTAEGFTSPLLSDRLRATSKNTTPWSVLALCVCRHRFHASSQAFEDKFTPVRVYQHHIFCPPDSSEQIIGAAAPWDFECSKSANAWEHTCSCRSLTYRCLISKGSTLFLLTCSLPPAHGCNFTRSLHCRPIEIPPSGPVCTSKLNLAPKSGLRGHFQPVKGPVPESLELQSLQQLAGDWCSHLSASEV